MAGAAAGLRVGIAHHLGWAVAVTADADHRVVDRRRIELVEAGLPAAPVHHEGGAWPMHQTGPDLDDDALAALVADVRASAVRCGAAALDDLAAAVPGPIASISLRVWDELPADIHTLRQIPHEAKADSVMYREVLADLVTERGWTVHRFDAKDVEGEASKLLGERAHHVLHGPRAELGPPWTKDHRMALAATVLAADGGRGSGCA